MVSSSLSSCIYIVASLPHFNFLATNGSNSSGQPALQLFAPPNRRNSPNKSEIIGANWGANGIQKPNRTNACSRSFSPAFLAIVELLSDPPPLLLRVQSLYLLEIKTRHATRVATSNAIGANERSNERKASMRVGSRGLPPFTRRGLIL